MITVLPNTGILMNDALDKLRGDALRDAQSGLPESVVYYLRSLESAYMDMKLDQKRSALREVAWKIDRLERGDG